MGEEEEKYRLGTVKKSINDNKVDEIISHFDKHKTSNFTKPTTEEIIDFYCMNYEVLPTSIDDKIVEILAEIDEEQQIAFLMKIQDIRLSVGSLSTFFRFWISNPKIKDNPIFKNTSFYKQEERLAVITQNLMDFMKRTSLPNITNQLSKTYNHIQKSIESMAKIFSTTSFIIPNFQSMYESLNFIGDSSFFIGANKPNKIASKQSEYIIRELPSKIDIEYKTEIGEMKEQMEYLTLAVQSGFISNKREDKKFFKNLNKKENLLKPEREKLLMVLAQRSMYREAAGIRNRKRYMKRLWVAIQAIEVAASLIIILQEKCLQIYQYIFG